MMAMMLLLRWITGGSVDAVMRLSRNEGKRKDAAMNAKRWPP